MTLHALASFHDLKQKRGGGGGLSDGNVVCIRRDLSTTTPAELGPPPGKAWQLVMNAAAGSVDAPLPVPGAYVSFDTSGGLEISESLVTPDGTEVPVAVESGIPSPGIASDAFQSWLVPGIILPYPFKLRAIISTGTPNGRVYLAVAFTEFDLPKDVVTD
jgi:hypothetical protein